MEEQQAAAPGEGNVAVKELHELVPREDTQALAFLKQNAAYDGRGVTIAILDSGVDVACEGLRTTSEGKVKVVDALDLTGGNDVDTSHTVSADQQGCITTLSGRTLKVPAQWKNPSGVYHLGAAPFKSFMPRGSSVLSRHDKKVKREHDEERDRELGRLQDAIESETSPEFVAELKSKKSVVEKLASTFPDAGPLYDTIVWHDGDKWRAVIDVSEGEALEQQTPLADYAEEHQYAIFDKHTALSYTVKIYDEGNLVTVVFPGSHGTHCAHIAAGHFPNAPTHNGVAPGAQIVSICIGDTRLGTMETSTGLVRAVRACLEHKVDIISMSYGESEAAFFGLFERTLAEFTKNHNAIFCTSAGNAGPCLTSAGVPHISTPYFKVAAYLTPKLGAAQSLRDPLSVPFVFTSRGPWVDGSGCPNIAAPGGAIAGVPQWALSPIGLKNGTSMSCPNLAGSVALLVSGFKARGIKYTPASVVQAVRHTAANVAPEFSALDYGSGLVQVSAAFEHHVQHPAKQDCFYKVSCRLGENVGSSGIYLRDWVEANPKGWREYKFVVRPEWPDDFDTGAMVQWQRHLDFECAAEWVAHTKSVTVVTEVRPNLNIKVTLDGLEKGRYHYTEVVGYDSEDRARGPVVRVPVTVIIPLEVSADGFWSETVSHANPEPPVRRFLSAPVTASHYKVRVKSLSTEGNLVSAVSTHQLRPGTKPDPEGFLIRAFVGAGQEASQVFECAASRTLEVAFCSWYSTLGKTTVEVSVQFYSFGVESNGFGAQSRKGTTIISDQTPALLSIRNFAERSFYVKPTVELQRLQRSVLPSGKTTRSLPERFNILDRPTRLTEQVLSYTFDIEKDSSVTLRTGIDESTYGFELQNVLEVFTVHGQPIHTWGWGGSEPNSSYGWASLSAGSYEARVTLRSDNSTLLQKLSDLPLIVESKLGSKTGVPLYRSLGQANRYGSTVSRSALGQGQSVECWVQRLPLSSFKVPLQSGDVLYGTLEYNSGELKDVRSTFRYVVQSAPEEKKKQSAASSSSSLVVQRDSVEDSLKATLLNAQVAFFESLIETKPFSEFEKQLDQAVAKNPDSLELKRVLLRAVMAAKNHADVDVKKVADLIIQNIDQDDLARHFGLKFDPGADDKKYELQREVLIEALFARASVSDDPKAEEDLKKWVATSDAQYRKIRAMVLRRKGKWADLILEALLPLATEQKMNERKTLEDIRDALGKLQLTAWEKKLQRIIATKFPQKKSNSGGE